MKSAPTPARRRRFHSSTTLAFGLGGGDANGHAAHFLDVLDLHVAVAEAQEFVATHAGSIEEPLE